MKYNYVIGIDPDCEKSGVVFIDVKNKHLMATHSLTFPVLIRYIKEQCVYGAGMGVTIGVFIEAAWLIGKHNWHEKKNDSKYVSNSKGYDVGRNHATGQIIVQMLRSEGIDVTEVKPLKKGWKGPDGKITHEELKYFVPELPNRTNQEVRDAVLIAWTYANLPIKIRP